MSRSLTVIFILTQNKWSKYYYYYYYYYYYIRLTDFFSRTMCINRQQKGKLFWILLKQEMMGWQWH